jgi:hypothetical protein
MWRARIGIAAGFPGIQPPRAESIHTQEEFEQADFGTKAQFASAAAWSPNPKNPPFFFDLPTKDGQVRNGIMAKWAANAPLAWWISISGICGGSRRSRSTRETKTPPSPRRSDAGRDAERVRFTAYFRDL